MSPKHLFFSDYLEGAHPTVMQALCSSNLQQEKGYGLDRFCLEAAALVRERISNKNAAGSHDRAVVGQARPLKFASSFAR
jgi:hypothetical protein